MQGPPFPLLLEALVRGGGRKACGSRLAADLPVGGKDAGSSPHSATGACVTLTSLVSVSSSAEWEC